MSDFNFTRFENSKARLENRITVTTSYSIGFPRKYYSDNHVDDYKFAILYFDASQLAIGIQFTNAEDEKGKFKILHNKNGGGSIMCRSFFKAKNLDPKQFRNRYEWTKEMLADMNAEVYVIKLRDRTQN